MRGIMGLSKGIIRITVPTITYNHNKGTYFLTESSKQAPSR